MLSRRPGVVQLASLLIVFGVPLAASLALDRAASSGASRSMKFFDVPSQTAEFIGYSRSVTLTPAQQKVREKALKAMAAPCCEEFPLATCCCPCNLAKSAWGLANYMIARRGAGAGEVREAVGGWLAFVNPNGFSGDACNSAGGCARRFAQNGCGGMDERNLLNA
ncbi:MAG TPA: hypothetical protein VFW15_12375, partial [Thermoanaerobaculia bacterium]|nr:hypothetical protein [Thermoanaerobaculia bacterium]